MDVTEENFLKLSKKVVFVTGANGQIGLSLINKLIKYKAKVIAIDIKVTNILKLKKNSIITDKNLLIIKCDIRNSKEIKKAFKKGINKFKFIDSLICNAGVAVFENFLNRNHKSLNKVIDVNIKGTFFCIQEFIKNFKHRKKEGTIVNIASHYGFISPDPRIYTDTKRASSEIYGASKAAIIQMTKYFAIHAISKNIRTNSISPGGISDDINELKAGALQKVKQGKGFKLEYSKRCPMKRLAYVDEVVNPILFLISSSSSYINGHNIVVDGGFSVW